MSDIDKMSSEITINNDSNPPINTCPNIISTVGGGNNVDNTINSVATGNLFALPAPISTRNEKTKKRDLPKTSDSDNESSDNSIASSASKKCKNNSNKKAPSISMQINDLIIRINYLEEENKKKDDLINSLTLAVNNFTTHLNEVNKSMIVNNNVNPNGNATSNEQKRPLFSDLFKSKETENFDLEVKNLYNFQQELNEQEFKKNNIIIYGLQYDTTRDTNYSVDADKNKIDNLLKYINFDLKKIKRFKRLFKKESTDYSNAPILIECNSFDDKTQLFKLAKNVKNNQLYSKVFFNNDLTKSQRFINKELVLLRNKLNNDDNTKDENINFYHTIRNGKVIKKNKIL